MKISQLDILEYGQLKQLSLNFDTSFQTIAGNNETGKSTIRQLITDILFGFPKINKYAPNNATEYGGQLYIQNGDENYKISRYKIAGLKIQVNNNGILVNNPDKFLDDLIKPFDRESFENIFSLSHENLATASLLKSSQLEELILKIGAMNSDKFQNLESIFEKQASTILKNKNGKSEVNLLLEHHKTLVKELKEKQNEFLGFVNERKKLDEINAQLEVLNLNERKKNEQINTLSNLVKLLPNYNRLNELKKEPLFIKEISDDDRKEVEAIQLRLEAGKSQTQYQISTDDIKMFDNYSSHKEELDNLRGNLNFVSDKFVQLSNLEKQKDEINNNPAIVQLDGQKRIKKRFIAQLVLFGLAIAAIVYPFFMAKNLLLPGAASAGVLILWTIILNFIRTKNDDSPLFQNIESIDQRIQLTQNELGNILKPVSEILSYLPDQGKIYTSKVVTDLYRYFSKIDSIQRDNNNTSSTSEEISKNIEQQKIIFDKYDVPDYEHFNNIIQNNNKVTNVLNEINQLETIITPDVRSQISANGGIDGIEERLSQIKLTSRQREIDDLEKIRFNLSTQLASIASNNILLQLEQKIENSKSNILSKLTNYYSYHFAGEWINTALKKITEDRLPKIIDDTNKYFSKLTNNKYNKIIFSDGKVLVSGEKQHMMSMQQLSKG
ncbi:MAG: AAA family ATPase, partial [Lactobacillaceae bacterium]|nr:AAA family ATPase [Lactobacillaceae bacterium]